MILLSRQIIHTRSIILFLVPILIALSACVKTPEKTALSLASEKGEISNIQQLVQHGADISAKDGRGLDALSYAIINEHPEVVSYLLKHGADANSANGSGITALIISATVGNNEIVKNLHEHGAQVNRATHDGITPLMAAAGSNNQDTIILLLSYGADPCSRDKNNLTARQTAEQWRGALETSRIISSNKKLEQLNCDKGGANG
ncbi:ankyrin repeat domain-containing protein [Caballeronia humi]|uniref:Ankyrin repeat-containing protein n=1 Tax=Caballeronia humi TaxID=326474 RepID=A0A158G765_9BURK|nr:ankyrin repeat domain-containing protein [Caballeronia humi]SAL27717.1 ankyrin repeat-containing protein [Caballeronia humi]